MARNLRHSSMKKLNELPFNRISGWKDAFCYIKPL